MKMRLIVIVAACVAIASWTLANQGLWPNLAAFGFFAAIGIALTAIFTEVGRHRSAIDQSKDDKRPH